MSDQEPDTPGQEPDTPQGAAAIEDFEPVKWHEEGGQTTDDGTTDAEKVLSGQTDLLKQPKQAPTTTAPIPASTEPVKAETDPAASTEPAKADGETDPQQAADEGDKEVELNDDTEIAIGKDDEGKPIMATMKELVDGYQAAQTGDATASMVGVTPAKLNEAVTGFAIEKIDGYQAFEQTHMQIEAQLTALKESYTPHINERAMLTNEMQSIDTKSDEFDPTRLMQIQGRLAQLENEIKVGQGQWQAITEQEQANTQAHAARSAEAIETIIGGFWSEYANPNTRATAVAQLATDVGVLYGGAAADVNVLVNRNPQAVAMMLDAIQYRKLAGKTALGGGIDKAIEQASKGGGKAHFVHKGATQAGGKARTGATGARQTATPKSNVLDFKNLTAQNRKDLEDGNIESLAKSFN